MSNETADDIIVIEIPLKLKRRTGWRKIIVPDDIPPEPTPLQYTLARAFHWQKILDNGEAESMTALAKQLGVNTKWLFKQLRLTMLAPDIVEMLLKGTAPESLSLERLYGLMPVLWEEQRKMYGLPGAAS
jgi:hypothetical protein